MKRNHRDNHPFIRPQAIIPYREATAINTINCQASNTLINSNISPLLYTPKIKVKPQTTLSPPTPLKKPANLPIITQKSERKEKHGFSDDIKVSIVRKSIRANSSKNNHGETPNKNHYKNNLTFYCADSGENQENRKKPLSKNKTFNEDFQTNLQINFDSSEKEKYPKSLIDKALKANIMGKNGVKKPLKPMPSDLKAMAIGKKLTMLKTYFKSLVTNGHNTSTNSTANGYAASKTKKKQKNNFGDQKPNQLAFENKPEKVKRFLTPTQKNRETNEQEFNKTQINIKKITTLKEEKNLNKFNGSNETNAKKLTNCEKPSYKKLSLVEGLNFPNNQQAKKLSIVEISSFLNSEELLKVKFKEKLQNNLWKISNETSTNDEMNSLMKKTSDFSIPNLSKPTVIVKNVRSDSIPNLLSEEIEELENTHRNKDKKSFEIPLVELEIERFLSQTNSMSPHTKILSNNEISDVVQKLSSSKKISKRGETFHEKPTFLYEDFFDFNKSQESFHNPISKKPYLTVDSSNLNDSSVSVCKEQEPQPQKQQYSPKCDDRTKTIKPLFNCYNNSKFASPLIKSQKKKRDFDEILERQSFEEINPIDEFCDDI